MKVNRCTRALTLGFTVAVSAITASAQDWTEKAIAPVTNPIFFETPLIQSEIRPIFAWHRLDRALLGTEVDVRLYALQLRYALNDRLALIATKDGFIEIDPKGGRKVDGWGDIGLGLKYAVYKDEDRQLMVTPGLTFEAPTGNQRVFQGNGQGEFNLFLSAIKGFDNLHFTANIGTRLPVDTDEETSSIRYACMVDYYTCKYFIPFATVSAFTTLSNARQLPFTSEGFDLINFGSSAARGETQAAVGFGFRSRLLEKVDLGFAWERGFTPNNDIFKDRFTVDLGIRF